VATGRKRGIVLSLILHCLFVLLLLYVAQKYIPVREGYQRKSPKISVVSQHQTTRSPHTKTTTPPHGETAPNTQESQQQQQPITRLISQPTEPGSSTAPQIMSGKKRHSRPLSSSGWYKQQESTSASSAPEQTTKGQAFQGHPLLPTVTKIVQEEERRLKYRDNGEEQAYQFEYEAYYRKLRAVFKQASLFYERTYHAERDKVCTIEGVLCINDEGIISEVKLSSSSGDKQLDAFVKDFFQSPQAPPLTPRLRGKPYTCYFRVRCAVTSGLRRMQMIMVD
jgi:hypothetical protein